MEADGLPVRGGRKNENSIGKVPSFVHLLGKTRKEKKAREASCRSAKLSTGTEYMETRPGITSLVAADKNATYSALKTPHCDPNHISDGINGSAFRYR